MSDGHGHDLDPYTFGEEQTCFGCGPKNDRGWRLRFRREGDEVVTHYTPTRGMEGPPCVFHGGLQATMADEIAGWTLVGLLGRMGVTTSMHVRYIRPMRIDEEVEGRGKLRSRTGNVATVDVSLFQGGKRGFSGRISFLLPNESQAASYLGGHLPESWRHLFREG